MIFAQYKKQQIKTQELMLIGIIQRMHLVISMDEYGFVNNLDLAKSILIMYFSNKFILERELVTKIKNELVEIEGEIKCFVLKELD